MLNYFLNYLFCLENLLFLIFSSILLFSGLFIIIVQNSIYSILFLILNFIAASGILFLLECDFLALLFLIIYVGAIAVLFLFVVMMLDVKILETPKDILKYISIGQFLGSLFLLEIFYFILNTFYMNPYKISSSSKYGNISNNYYTNYHNKIDSLTDIKALGQVLYNDYILQLLLVGLILLLAVLGSVSLTMSNISIKSKRQSIFKQVSRGNKTILIF